jgi:hypothetical protein
MPKNSALCGIAQSAMPPSVKFKSKIFLPTPRYAAQRGVDSVLCGIAESRDSVHGGELRIRNHMQKYFYPLVSDPSGIDS